MYAVPLRDNAQLSDMQHGGLTTASSSHHDCISAAQLKYEIKKNQPRIYYPA